MVVVLKGLEADDSKLAYRNELQAVRHELFLIVVHVVKDSRPRHVTAL